MFSTVNIVLFFFLGATTLSEESPLTDLRKAIFWRPPPLSFIKNSTALVISTLFGGNRGNTNEEKTDTSSKVHKHLKFVFENFVKLKGAFQIDEFLTPF